MAFPIQLRSRMDVPAVVEDYASRTFASRLAKFAEHIMRASISFEDEAGPRGMEKVCRVKVMLKDQEPIVFEVRASAAREALDRAVDGVERAVRRAVERFEELRGARRGGRGRAIAKTTAKKTTAKRKKRPAPAMAAPTKARPSPKSTRKTPSRAKKRAALSPKARAKKAARATAR